MAGGKKAKKRKRPSRSPDRGRRKHHRALNKNDGDHVNSVLVFQECARTLLSQNKSGDDSENNLNSNQLKLGKDQESTTSEHNNDTDAASIFFELANSPLIGYKISKNQTIVIRQDNNCAIHTGGIVWETSYLLAEFLSEKFGSNISDSCHPLGKTLEIGAGCGMLGLILATNGLASKVVLTEAEEVMDSLKENVDGNAIDLNADNATKNEHTKTVHGTNYLPVCPRHSVSVRRLRWDHLGIDIKQSAASGLDASGANDLEPHSFDTIIGTDVVFSPSLVCPLLKTISKMARKKSKKLKSRDKNTSQSTGERATLIYLCLQIRCPDSHALLFSEASKYNIEVIDVSEELKTSKCSWGLELECVMLKLNVLPKKSRNK